MALYRTDKQAALVALARSALGMTQQEFGELMGISVRTVARYESGGGFSPAELAKLAAAVYPKDEELAGHLATHAHGTLESLGIVKPASLQAKAAAPPPIPTELLVDSVVCAAATATNVTPEAVRPALRAAFERARAMRLSVEGIDEVLQGTSAGAGGSRAVGRKGR